MAQYKHNQAFIEAIQVDMKNINEASRFLKPNGEIYFYQEGWFKVHQNNEDWFILQNGDYIVRFDDGSFYPIDGDDFEKMYGEVKINAL